MIVRSNINELADSYDFKNMHEKFEHAQKLLIEEVKKYIKVATLTKEHEFSDDLLSLLKINQYDGEPDDGTNWKVIFSEDYVEPIIEALDTIKSKISELQAIEGAGDLKFRSNKKPSFLDRFKK